MTSISRSSRPSDPRTRACGWLVVFASIAACSSSHGAISAASKDSGTPDTGLVDAGDPCGHSLVPAAITASMTLTRACSPWTVSVPVTVGDASNPVLTIEPGVSVRFEPNAYLSVGEGAPGELVAQGTADAPIAFTSTVAEPRAGSWGGLVFGPSTGASSTLSYVSITYAGGPSFGPATPTAEGAVIVDGDDGALSLLLANVTISQDAASGFVFWGRNAGFAAGSGNLTVADWTSQGYPIEIDANEADTIPSTITTGASGNLGAIGLLCQTMSAPCAVDTIDHDVTFPSLPIPYVVEGTSGGPGTRCGINVDAPSGTPATLTIAPPNTLEFVTSCGLTVDADATGAGELVAMGTASAPITFTSAREQPTPGDWAGIDLVVAHDGALAATDLDHCAISYGSFGTRSQDPAGEIYVDGNHGSCPGGFSGPRITNTTFSQFGDGCGLGAIDISNESTYGTMTAGSNGNVFMQAPPSGGDVCGATSC